MTQPADHSTSSKEQSRAGIDRSHAPSIVTKTVFCLLHLASVLICISLVFGEGMQVLSGCLSQDLSVVDLDRGRLMVRAVLLYWIRHTITLFYLLLRRVEWGEVIGLSAFMLIFEVGLSLLGAGVLREEPIPIGPLDFIAIALVLVGSFLNTGSEMQRKWWKRNPENKGHCYTEGLFAWSMHINYFGDTVLFTGWCLLTACSWTLALPALMAASFIFYHIPGLDSYLADRYGAEFEEYAEKTKTFIPFVY